MRPSQQALTTAFPDTSPTAESAVPHAEQHLYGLSEAQVASCCEDKNRNKSWEFSWKVLVLIFITLHF